MNKEEIKKMLASFKMELRNDIDTNMKTNFQANLKPVGDEIIPLKSQINTIWS